jgi:hypothetical protein
MILGDFSCAQFLVVSRFWSAQKLVVFEGFKVFFGCLLWKNHLFFKAPNILVQK